MSQAPFAGDALFNCHALAGEAKLLLLHRHVLVEIIVHVEPAARRVGIERAHLDQVFLLDSDDFETQVRHRRGIVQFLRDKIGAIKSLRHRTHRIDDLALLALTRCTISDHRYGVGESIMRKTITKEEMALLKEATEMFNETGCVPGIDGEQVPAERIVPEVKQYVSETIDNPEAIYDPEIWDTPGFTLILSWLAQKWHQRCQKLAHRRSKNSEQYLTKEQQKACLESAAVELIREITQQRSLN